MLLILYEIFINFIKDRPKSQVKRNMEFKKVFPANPNT